MAFFTNDNKQFDKSNSNGATIIAAGSKFKGDIDSQCHIHIDGEFEGNITSTNTILIGKSGSSHGQIYANRVVVGGYFKGIIEADFIEILPNGRVEGTIVFLELFIEKKGIFIGESKIKSKSEAKIKD